MSEKSKDIVKTDVDHLEKVLKGIEQAVNAKPVITDMLDEKRWQYNALEKVQEDDLNNETLQKLADTSQEILKLSIYDFTTDVTSLSGAVVSDSTSVATTVVRVAENDDNAVWASMVVSQYQEIQNKHDIINKIELLLGGLTESRKNPPESFKGAVDECKVSISENRNFLKASVQLRNVLEDVKGVLFVRSDLSGVSRASRWDKMSRDLSKDGTSLATLLYEKSNYDSLHLKLTNITKKNVTTNSQDFEFIFMEFLNHLYAVLQSI